MVTALYSTLTPSLLRRVTEFSGLTAVWKMKPRSSSVPRPFIEEVFGRSGVPACQYSNLPPDLFYHHKRHYKSIPCASSLDIIKMQFANSPGCHIRIERSYVRKDTSVDRCKSRNARYCSPNTSLVHRQCHDQPVDSFVRQTQTSSRRCSAISTRAETRCSSALGDRKPAVKTPYEKENTSANVSIIDPRAGKITIHPSAAYLQLMKTPMKLKPKLMDIRAKRSAYESKRHRAIKL